MQTCNVNVFFYLPMKMSAREPAEKFPYVSGFTRHAMFWGNFDFILQFYCNRTPTNIITCITIFRNAAVKYEILTFNNHENIPEGLNNV